jgi:hypothetical protein
MSGLAPLLPRVGPVLQYLRERPTPSRGRTYLSLISHRATVAVGVVGISTTCSKEGRLISHALGRWVENAGLEEEQWASGLHADYSHAPSGTETPATRPGARVFLAAPRRRPYSASSL